MEPRQKIFNLQRLDTFKGNIIFDTGDYMFKFRDSEFQELASQLMEFPTPDIEYFMQNYMKGNHILEFV